MDPVCISLTTLATCEPNNCCKNATNRLELCLFHVAACSGASRRRDGPRIRTQCAERRDQWTAGARDLCSRPSGTNRDRSATIRTGDSRHRRRSGRIAARDRGNLWGLEQSNRQSALRGARRPASPLSSGGPDMAARQFGPRFDCACSFELEAQRDARRNRQLPREIAPAFHPETRS